jgi:hypothetical protein
MNLAEGPMVVIFQHSRIFVIFEFFLMFINAHRRGYIHATIFLIKVKIKNGEKSNLVLDSEIRGRMPSLGIAPGPSP